MNSQVGCIIKAETTSQNLMEEYQERDRSWSVKDPLLLFVLDGVKYSVEQNKLTWEEARDNVIKWFPDAQIVLRQEEQADG